MASIAPALKEVFKVEFNDKPDRFLHRNQGEEGWTLGGVYQKAHPTQINWNLVDRLVSMVGMTRASTMLYYDPHTMESVMAIFFNKYWSPLKCDQIQSQKIANEIFVMGVVGGIKQATKLAQRVVGVEDDGLMGVLTLEAINKYDEDKFDVDYDNVEIDYFEYLAETKPKFERFLQGWKNRAVLV